MIGDDRRGSLAVRQRNRHAVAHDKGRAADEIQGPERRDEGRNTAHNGNRAVQRADGEAKAKYDENRPKLGHAC